MNNLGKDVANMKKMIRLTALLVCVACLFGFSACVTDAPEDVPAGMKIATAAGADFRLYVPTSWNANTAYGVSGGYYNLNTQSSVSVVKYPITEEMEVVLSSEEVATLEGGRLEAFWSKYCQTALDAQILSGTKGEVVASADLLNGVNARRFATKGVVDGADVCIEQVVAEKDSAFYVFSFIVDVTLYESLLPHVESMLDVFVFADPYLPDDYMKDLDEDVEAPAGMKLASNKDVAYRFFVPENWTVDREVEIFAAYLESDRSSVSVVPYMPDAQSMSVAEFFTMCQEMMQSTAGTEGYELLEHHEVDLGGRKATAYTYRYTVGGVEYKYMQVIAAYKSMIYSMTYTALPENFDAHLSDVNQMIDAFEFR